MKVELVKPTHAIVEVHLTLGNIQQLNAEFQEATAKHEITEGKYSAMYILVYSILNKAMQAKDLV